MKPFLIICSCLLALHLHAQRPVPENTVQLKTIDGKPLALPGHHKQLTALVFLSPECPLSRNYTLVLNELQRSKKDVLDVIGVFAGTDYTDQEIKAFQQKYKIDFVLARDKKEALVAYTKATITPEVFLYDKQGTLQYKGAIDDWAISLGKTRQQAHQHYLRNAIDNCLQHKEVSPKETKAVGCFISNK